MDLKESVWRTWNALMWLRVGKSGGLLFTW